MRQAYLLCWLMMGGITALSACYVAPSGGPTLPPTYVEIPYTELVLEEIDRAVLTNPGIPGCSLADLRPFGVVQKQLRILV